MSPKIEIVCSRVKGRGSRGGGLGGDGDGGGQTRKEIYCTIKCWKIRLKAEVPSFRARDDVALLQARLDSKQQHVGGSVPLWPVSTIESGMYRTYRVPTPRQELVVMYCCAVVWHRVKTPILLGKRNS